VRIGPGTPTSSSGTLAYIPAVATDVRLARVDRAGATEVLNPPAGEYFDPKLSPDGDRVAVLRRRGPDANDLDLWVYDVNRRTMTRLTFDGNNVDDVWTRDGKRLIYTSATFRDPAGNASGVWQQGPR
jgi:Tol biopolymer transport system component